jgi:hypothetical protein
MHTSKDLMWWVEEEIFWVGMGKWTRPKKNFRFAGLHWVVYDLGWWAKLTCSGLGRASVRQLAQKKNGRTKIRGEKFCLFIIKYRYNVSVVALQMVMISPSLCCYVYLHTCMYAHFYEIVASMCTYQLLQSICIYSHTHTPF